MLSELAHPRTCTANILVDVSQPFATWLFLQWFHMRTFRINRRGFYRPVVFHVIQPRTANQRLWSYNLMALYKYIYHYYEWLSLLSRSCLVVSWTTHLTADETHMKYSSNDSITQSTGVQKFHNHLLDFMLPTDSQKNTHRLNLLAYKNTTLRMSTKCGGTTRWIGWHQ